MWEGYLYGAGNLSRRCRRAVCRLWEGCLEDVGRMSKGCGKADLRAIWSG